MAAVVVIMDQDFVDTFSPRADWRLCQKVLSLATEVRYRQVGGGDSFTKSLPHRVVGSQAGTLKPMASSFEVGAVWRVVGNGIMSLDLSSCPGRFTLPGRFRNALHYLLFQMQREIVRLVLAKYLPLL